MIYKEKHRVSIICGYPFPKGMAATSRIIAYSKGLVENNVDVDVYIYNPSELKDKQLPKSGNYKGINFCYPYKRARKKNKLIHGFEIVFGLVFSFFKILRENKKRKFTAVIISCDNVFRLFLFSFMSKIGNIKSIFIFDEYPTPIRGKLKNKVPFWKELCYKLILKNVDAYISISQKLAKYFNSYTLKKTLILPVITDTSRFNTSYTKIKDKNDIDYICYMGNMELSKDNIDIIIKAFALIKDDFSNLKLHLYGTPNKENKEIIKSLISNLKLENSVFIMGRISSELVPEILMKAKMLVSSQPDTLRASGGFPTKLGEYLASGVPALLTNVGENSKYVEDGVHVFFTVPNNAKAYAKKMDYILSNYNEAQKVACNGRLYLEKNYSHHVMGKKIKDFIININN